MLIANPLYVSVVSCVSRYNKHIALCSSQSFQSPFKMIYHCSTHNVFPRWSLARQCLSVCRKLDASNKSVKISPFRSASEFAFVKIDRKNNVPVHIFQHMHSWTPNSFVVLRASLRKYSSDTGSDYSQTRGNANAPGKILEQRNSSKTEVSSRIIAQIFPWWRRSNPTSKAPLQTEPPAPFQNINQQPDVVPIKVQLQFDGRLNWWKIILQDLLDTWNMIYAARKLILTFASILFAINRLYIYEADYLWSVFNRSKPTSSIARWVHSFSTVSMPRLPTYSEPSLSYTLLGCVAAEWLKTPLNFFTQISCSFACMDLPNVKDNILLLILLMPALKQVMSSKTISIAYVLGGFIAVNLHCASQYLFNPHSSLSTSELQRKLDAISLLEHQRSHRSKLWDDARTKLSTLSQDVVDLKDEEMRKEQSDDKTAGNKDPTDEKNVTDSPKETGINEEDLMLKGSREGNPAVTEFNKDGSSHAELTGNEIEKEKSNDPPVKDNEEVLEKKPSQDGVELNVADETAIAVDSSNNETTPPPPEKPLHQQIAEKLEEITKTKQEIAALQQTQLLFDYAGVSLGTSCSMTCLSTYSPSHPSPPPLPT